MEVRDITICDTESNSKVIVSTDATTFSQLKDAVRRAGINVEGKDWFEAITKNTFGKNDDAVLPHDVEYKGQITNNLVFMLTKTEKRISSGISRSDLYAEIKTLGIAEDIKKKFKGRNYTQVSTDDLVKCINNAKKKNQQLSEAQVVAKKVDEVKDGTQSQSKTSTPIDYKLNYEKMVKGFAALIVSCGEEIVEDIDAAVKELSSKKPKNIKFSEEELRELMGK